MHHRHHLGAISSQITPLIPKQVLISHNYYTSTNKVYFSSPWPLITCKNNRNKWWVLTAEREPKYEVDQEKARQALSDLDQQFELLSNKQISPPKVRASSFANMKGQMREDAPEMTGSVLGSFAFLLFLFSIFYNIFFITVIKHSVDLPDDAVVANVSTSEASAVRQQP